MRRKRIVSGPVSGPLVEVTEEVGPGGARGDRARFFRRLEFLTRVSELDHLWWRLHEEALPPPPPPALAPSVAPQPRCSTCVDEGLVTTPKGRRVLCHCQLSARKSRPTSVS